MLTTNTGGYQYPPNIKPYTSNTLQNNGYYAYTEPLAPLKAFVKRVVNKTIFNVSRETISQYIVPVVTTDTADSYIVFSSAGYKVVDNRRGKYYVSTCDNIATLIQDGKAIPDSSATHTRCIVVFQTNISESRILMMNSTSTYDDIIEMLLSIGAINANIIYDSDTAVSLRKGKPIYGDYPTETYETLLGFTLAEPCNDIQYLFGKIIQDINYLEHTKGSGGGGGEYDDTELRQMIADLKKQLDDFELYVTDTIWIRYTDPFTGQMIGRSGVDDIVQDLNTRCLDLANRIIAIGDGTGYDDTELRQRIELLESDVRELTARLNTVEIKDSNGVVVQTGTMEQSLNYLYNLIQGGGDEQLEGRVTSIENRLNTFSLSWQGADVITGTIEEVSQWLYNYTRQELSGLHSNIEDIDHDITDLQSTTAQQTIDISNRAVTNHASTGDTFGIGNATFYGHLRLSSSLTSGNNTSNGVAATPSAVRDLNNLITALTDRVTALEESSGGGSSEVWTPITTAWNSDNQTTTGWYKSVDGRPISVNYNGTTYQYGRMQVINGWDNQATSGLVTPTRAVVQIFYHQQSDSSASSAIRRIMQLVRYGTGAGWTQPSTLTWTDWQPIIYLNYDGTTPV